MNSSHTVGRNKKGGHIIRSKEYKDWLTIAGCEYRRQYPGGVSQKITGRMRVDYVFIWNEKSRGKNSSDISNREKVLSDFLQHKFFDNDNQIDEQHHYRRISNTGADRVIVRMYEIPDRRFDDPGLILNPKKKEDKMSEEKVESTEAQATAEVESKEEAPQTTDAPASEAATDESAGAESTDQAE